MYQVYNLKGNANIQVNGQEGPFTIITHTMDQVSSGRFAKEAYYASKMHYRQRQLIVSLSKGDVCIRAGSMQWMAGDVRLSSGVKGIGDYISRKVKAKLTRQEAVHPVLTGTGLVVCEPTTRNLFIVDLDSWNGSIVLGECRFLAMEEGVKLATVGRTNLSSAALGKEGMFNYCLQGSGLAVLEIVPPKEELVTVVLTDDILRIDGNFAVAWSDSLQFTVEPAASSWIGSAISGEGLVNVYRGTGTILLAPLPDLFPTDTE